MGLEPCPCDGDADTSRCYGGDQAGDDSLCGGPAPVTAYRSAWQPWVWGSKRPPEGGLQSGGPGHLCVRAHLPSPELQAAFSLPPLPECTQQVLEHLRQQHQPAQGAEGPLGAGRLGESSCL